MPHHARSDRAPSIRPLLHVEPLEDRLLLAALAPIVAPATASAAHTSWSPPKSDDDSAYASAPGKSSSDTTPYAHPVSAPATQADPTPSYRPETASAPATSPSPLSSANLAFALLAPPAHPGEGRASATSASALQSAIVNLPSSIVNFFQPAAGVAVLSAMTATISPHTPDETAQGDVDRNPGDRPAVQPTDLPAEQPTPADVREQPPDRFPFALPGLDLAGWNEAAQRLLRVLQALDDESGTVSWTTLGFWGVAAVSTVVLSELARQHLAQPHGDDPEETRWRERR